MVVGGTVGEWRALSDEQWTSRLADLAKVADHIAARWLTLRPYETGPGPIGELGRRSAEVGGCTVLASEQADGRQRLVEAIAAIHACDQPIDEQHISAVLNAPAETDPDVVLVLGPHDRLPPSLVWELAYSELVFIDIAWADLHPMHLDEAITAFRKRHRRFGGID